MHFSFIINTKSNFKKNQHHMKIKTKIQNIIKKLKNIKINVKKTIKNENNIWNTLNRQNWADILCIYTKILYIDYI